jgi:uncharacterized integral membrane protein (TIGR00698 family)
MAFALLLANPYAAESKKASNILLRTSVVLLGFSMDLGVVLRAGAEGLPFAAATICGTLVLGWLLGRALKIRARTSALIASGTAICGGSAIAAVGSVLGAEEGEMSVAIGTVFLLNAVALYTFPLFGHALHLSQAQFGTWAGVAIHDISSVVGAAQVYGSQALQHATAVKLSRALWIVPLSLGAAAAYKVYTHGAERTAAKVQIPWFIGLFVLASLARSLFPPIAALAPNIAVVAKIGFTLTLFLIGSGLSKKNLKAVGWKPLAQGVALWVFISITSLIVISRTIS